MQAAQRPLEAATEAKLVPSQTLASTSNSLTIVFLFLAVFLVAAGTSFLQAYLRDHRSSGAAGTTREIRIAPSPDGNLAIQTDAQTGRVNLPERGPDRTAPEILNTQPKPREDLPVVSKALRERVPSRSLLKQTNAPKAQSASVKPASKPMAAPTQVRRSPEQQTIHGASAPALPLNSTAGTQPSLLSQQTLLRPPEPLKSTVQSGANSTQKPNASSNQAPSGPGPARAAQTTPQPGGPRDAGYIPARPLKWAAPDAKSLGVSRIAQAVDIAVKIRIDESGRVTSAHALIDGSVRDPAVMAAATAVVKQWTFEPAKMQGKNVASEDTVVIHVDPKR